MSYHQIFSKTKHPTFKIVQPDNHIYNNGQVIIGWWIFYPPKGCCTLPDAGNLSVLGWISSGLFLILFWPLTCLPCFLSSCYEGYQIPVYSNSKEVIHVQPSAPPIPIAYGVKIN